MATKCDLINKFSTESEKTRKEIREERFKRTMEELKSRMSNEELPIAIEKLIESKHMDELSDLLSTQYREKANTLSGRLSNLIEEKLVEMHKVKEEMEQQYSKLQEGLDSNVITPSDYERRMKDLQERENDKLRDIELIYIQKENDLQQGVCGELCAKNEEELLKLREIQFVEKNSIMSELGKTNQYARGLLNGDPQHLMALELNEYKKQLNEEKERRMKEFEARGQRLHAIAIENQGKIKLFNEETQRFLDELARREKEKLEKKKKELEETRRRQEQDLNNKTGITEAEKQKMLEDYNNELDALMKAMNAEQKRQSDQMMQRLQDRWSEKEKLKGQKQLQLLLYKKEVEETMDSQIKQMQIKMDTKVEAKDTKTKIAGLIKNCEKTKTIYFKKKPVAGVEMAEVISVIQEEKVDVEEYKETAINEGTLLNIDFDELLRSIMGLQTKVSGFTDSEFAKLLEGFRNINKRLNDLRTKALSKR